ncbi:Ig-like domain-containing domain [Chryseosolibacter indicus]|uniref:Ig-like domain-containing protein n=1 Tax=Chryseosolibacter indicus TaxID=2782351 RepID=A0ABS5VNU7_9BACT|nr:Ig-like domain-containing domain [Chryseosolibacter indicus]MBT1703120.1 Ig-like domain-containing protein [Chryseosolibacter indicus]
MTLYKNLHWFIYILFFFSCARQSAPTGGPKDTIPPRLVRVVPADQSINFKGKSLELTFSEMINLANPKEQIIIAPTIGKTYNVEARNNKVVLDFETTLKDSTTYTFNFRDAVQDVTEKNPARNLRIAVSTGSYIDSMSVEGIAFDILEQKALKDITVAVQPYNDTFSILKHPATFITKTDEDGIFQIQNLKPGLYNIYAIADQNKNLIVDSKSEQYGFKRDSFLLDQNIKDILLGLVKLDTRQLKITSARPYNTYFNIRASKNLKSFSLSAIDGSDVYFSYGADQSNILVYNTLQNKDSTQIKLHLEDSIQNKIDTALYVKFNKREVEPEKFTAKVDKAEVLADKGIFRATFSFSKPLKEIDFDSLRFSIDTSHVITFNQNDVIYDEPTKKLTLSKKFDKNFYQVVEEPTPVQPNIPDTTKSDKPEKPNIENEFYIGKAAFISVELDSSNQTKQSISPSRYEDMGVIIVETKQSPDNTIIQLVDNQGNIIESTIKKSYSFEDLQPSTYQLRIILDRNGNGVWDAGNYIRKEEPEEIFYWEDENGQREIKLKANFEIGPLLITY